MFTFTEFVYILSGMVYFAFQKTADGNGESYGSEVFIMRSKDLLELHDLDKPQEATWETLPKGDKGWLVLFVKLGQKI